MPGDLAPVHVVPPCLDDHLGLQPVQLLAHVLEQAQCGAHVLRDHARLPPVIVLLAGGRQQPPYEQVEAAAAGAREHLGFPAAEVERPVSLDDVDLPPPRLEPPGSLAHICSSERYERVTHSYGKSYRDVVRAFRGRFDNPPDVIARPGDEADVERVLAWCEEAGAAAIPFGGGTSVVGGVEPPGERPAVTVDLGSMDRVLEVDSVSRAALIQAGSR